ncbi:SDR family NAD(P)-dependent oxidoreductase [Streptomyces sp. NRRL_ISP-5395]|uniref:SDR family oxidoreductase n=1 Tax=Streptomyces TaxID=1883 RepID=UPI0004C63A36|nr:MULTISPECIES: SDR family NAD(P)-dependent oxidoreductase [Streptomyces]MDX2672038.1 SDR family NAD(P)-dependent oxidoreductase [Streptomyces sp. NRRL_ISP-5395]GHF56750.1 short-chain dehydrogenase [Streptomyces griseus]
MNRSPAGAVVTGAGRGLGRLIAAILVERGHRVLVTDIDEDAAHATAAELGPDVLWAAVDVRDETRTAAARDLIMARSGRLDVWVNNAGVLATGPAWEQPPEVRRLMLEVNGLGTVNGTVAAIEAMRGTGGHIVNVVSLAGLTAVPGEAVYAASKHAAIGFSLSTLADLRLAGIKEIDISCLCPDGIWTPMLHDKLDDPASALSFSGALLEPEEAAAAVRKVLDRPRPVTAIPRRRGLQVRLADAFPSLGLRAVPLAVARGRRVQRKMRAGAAPK